MSIELSWYPHLENVAYWRFTGAWTWDEFFKCYEQEKHMVTALQGARWDTLGEFLDRPALPHSSGAVGHVMGTLRWGKETNMGLLVVITRNTFIRAMVKIATQLHPGFRATFFATDTFAAAEAAIQQSRVQR